MSNLNLALIEELVKLKTIPDFQDDIDIALNLMESLFNDFTIEHFECEGVKSILVYNTENRPNKFKLILNSHLDVIPGSLEKYQLQKDVDKLYGVGVMDMKSNLVMAVEAFKNTANKVSFPIAMQIVTDEEVGGFKGTRYQIENGVNAEFVISTEPTNFDIVNQAKGVLWLSIQATGVTAHGAYPWCGKNAVETIIDVTEKIKTIINNPKSEKWQTTCNVAGIDTKNNTYNKIPDECTLRLDIRFIPEDKDKILNEIKAVLSDNCKLTVVANESDLNTATDNKFVKMLAQVTADVIGKETILRPAQGSSDARHYQAVGTAGIEFGPIGGGIGSDEEWVSIDSLLKYQLILEKFILNLSH